MSSTEPRTKQGKAAPATEDAWVTSRNLSAVFLMRMAQFPFLLLFAVLVPRMMGSEVYGQFALIIAITTILASLVNLGIGDVFGRFVPEVGRGESAPGVARFASNFLAFKTLVSLGTVILVTPILYYVYADSLPAASFLLIALIVLVVDWGSVFYSLLFGQNRLVRYSVRDPLRRALSLVLILLLFPRFGLIGALFSTLLVDFLLLLLGLQWTKSSLSVRHLRFDLGFLRPYLAFGVTVYLSWFLLNLWQRVGNVLIHHITGNNSEVAYFDIANQLFLVALSITVIVLNSLIPMFSKFVVAGQEPKIHEWSGRLVRYMLIVNMLGFTAMVFVADDLIPLLIGENFTQVSPNAIVLLLAIFPAVFVQIGFVYALVYKRPGRFLLALIGAFVAFVVLSVFLIARYQALGCSVAMVISYSLMAALTMYPLRDRAGLLLKEACLVLAPAAPLLPLAYLDPEPVLNAGLAIAVGCGYVALLLSFRILKVAEVREVIGALRAKRPEAT